MIRGVKSSPWGHVWRKGGCILSKTMHFPQAAEALAEADKALSDGADDYLQLINCASVLMSGLRAA